MTQDVQWWTLGTGLHVALVI